MDTAERISRLSPEQRKLLEQKLQKENIDILKLSIDKQKRSPDQASSGRQRFPLSFAQERLWFIQQLAPDNYAYNITKLLKLEGIPDKQALEQSINEIIKRHEILRTIFIPGPAGPVQVILDRLALFLKTIDLRLPAENQEDEIQRIIREESRYVFDLTRGPLLRTRLLILEEKKYIFLLVIHHIICDGTSFQVFFRELLALYQFFSRGKPANLPQLASQYADYACWQRQWSNLNTKQAAYWLEQFKGEIPVLQLPLDYPRPLVQDFKGDTIDFYLPGSWVNVLKEIAVKEKTTLNVVLLALYNIFLSRVGGQEDIVVGTPIAGRRHPAVKNLIGMFVNTLALRNYPLHHLTLKEFLAGVTRRTFKAFDNQEYEYESLVDKLQVNRDTSRNPLFDVMFYLGNIEFPIMNIQGLTLKSYDPGNKTAKFDLLLRAREEEEGLHFYLEYCTGLFKENTIKRFINYFRQVVAAAVNNKDLDIKLLDLEMLPEEEKQHILHEFNNTSAGYPLNKTLDQLFSRQAGQTPDHIAVISRQQHLTYRELARQSEHLAQWLVEKGVQVDTIVAVMLGRSLEMIIGILGILKAGGGYLPIDADYPPERINYMLADSNVGILVTTPKLPDKVKAEVERRFIKIIDISALSSFSTSTLTSTCRVSPTNLAYVIYTSGSTGKPKGVMLEQQNLVNLLFYDFKCTTLDFSVVLQFSTISFDVSFNEIFATLVWGGKLCLIDEEMRTNVPELFKLIREKQIKTVFLPMALLKLIFNEPAYISLFPACVGHIQTAGEQVVINSASREFLKTRQIPLHNHYGPSETHVVTALTLFPPGDIPELPAIGKPVSNTQVYILDKHERIQPIGIPGELYIGGVQVGRGYLNNPALTAGKFTLNPYKLDRSNMSYKSYLLYRTGDLARWLEDGNIELLGRIDYQVKIRGYRVEVGEIEAQLLNHDAVQEAVVLVKEDAQKEKYLCAYIKKTGIPGSIGIEELRTYLSGKLPGYMIPSYFVFLDQVPLTPSGKIDRKALPHPGTPLSKKYIAPRDEVEKKLVELWVEVLSMGAPGEQLSSASPQIGVEDNFFQIGGHSLKAALAAAKIHKEFNVRLPLGELFKTPTIRGLARCIAGLKEDKYIPVEPAEKKEYYKLSPAQKRLYILQQMETANTSYNLPNVIALAGEIDREKIEEIFGKLVNRHESLRTSFEMIAGEPVQRIHEQVEFEIKYYLATGEENRKIAKKEKPAGFNSQLAASTMKSFIHPFDLSHAPLLRVGLLHTAPFGHPGNKCTLLVDMHHIISDQTSNQILAREFTAAMAGKELPHLRLMYKDYTEWCRKNKQKQTLEKQETYWMKLYPAETPVLNLPTDFPRPAHRDFTGNQVEFAIGIEETRALKKIALKEGMTSYMLMLAIFFILLSKLSGQDDIIVGTDVQGRPHENLEQVIGMFVNTLALRNYPAREKTFKEFLKQIKEQTGQAFENQDYPFDDLVEKRGIQREASRNPLFDVMFALQNQDPLTENRTTGNTPDHTLHPGRLETGTSKFDLLWVGVETPDRLLFTVEYGKKLFKQETINNFIRYYKEIIDKVIEVEDIKLKEIHITHDLLAAAARVPAIEFNF